MGYGPPNNIKYIMGPRYSNQNIIETINRQTQYYPVFRQLINWGSRTQLLLRHDEATLVTWHW